ncbi:MAG: VOC family protein [Minisyncoccia bacterium]
MKIHHVALTVNNIEESIEWYKQVFNAEVIHSYEKDGRQIAHVRIGEAQVEFFAFKDGAEALPDYSKELQTDLRVVGTKHFCLAVEDLESTMAELSQKGAVFATDVRTAGFGGRYVFVKDCNDILIELYEV